jgi:Glyoxalase-like domain
MNVSVPVDHIVYGVDDLASAVDQLAGRLGVRPVAGGRHVGRGTHNALLGLGGGAYLEVIALDPEQPRPEAPLPFGLDRLRLPRLVGWASRSADIEGDRARARERGHDPGEVRPMSRRRPDGVLLEWRLTRDAPDPDRLVVPFLIDWGRSPHPSESAPAGVRLVELRAEHPDPAAARAQLDALGLALPVGEGPEQALVATLDTPEGRVVLR